MKKRAFKPGFEFIFSLSLLIILGLPPFVSAQKVNTDLNINITNGDTTINGKNIKELSAAERKDALKNISRISVINSDNADGPRDLVIVTKKEGDQGRSEIVIEKKGTAGDEEEPIIADNDVNANGTKVQHLRIRINRNGNDSTYAFNYNTDNAPKHRMEVREFRMNDDKEGPMRFNRRNTQNFMYTNTDNNGISTRVGYHVSDHQAMLDYDAGKPERSQLEMLDLTDLNIIPEFSAGKTVLMFSLPSKAVAEVQFKDSKGNLLWSGKALNGSFSKSFALGLNGLYYLQVKQGNKVAVKEIMKD